MAWNLKQQTKSHVNNEFDSSLWEGDPTMSACCIRDLQERKQAAAWKNELNRLDPVQRAVNLATNRGGILSTKAALSSSSSHACYSSFPTGQFVETSECNAAGSIQSGQFVLSIITDKNSPAAFEERLRDWLDGFDAVLFIHRFRPNTCRSCVLDDEVRLPALLAYSNNQRVLLLDRNRLEAENESSLLARLTLLKRQHESSGSKQDNSDSEEEEQERGRTGRNEYFKCGKQGCNRTFHHVHVQSFNKNATFEKSGGDDEQSDESDREDF